MIGKEEYESFNEERQEADNIHAYFEHGFEGKGRRMNLASSYPVNVS